MMHCVTVLPDKRTVKVTEGSRLLDALQSLGIDVDIPCGGNGTCGKCRVIVNGRPVLACSCSVDSDLVVELPPKKRPVILTDGTHVSISVDPGYPGYMAAFDIGTTTVVCFLLSPEGEEISVESMLNPQTSYGADVISRIHWALKGKREELTASIRDGMQELLRRCCQNAGIHIKEIGVISVVANPCMQQLFMGIELSNLAAAPFEPIIKQADVKPAVDYFPICPNAVLLVVPNISGYVGSDTMGCILASSIYDTEETTLMVDIGTNGEIVLAHKGKMVACSAAAGPALEGANILFGMRGAAGAVDHVWWEDGKVTCSVIGDGPAVGICGSGIIDAVAVMLEIGALNKRGKIISDEELDGKKVFRLNDTIYLTQEDVRQVQIAKGAIAAGIRLMAEWLGISMKEIDQVLLAGAFGSFLDAEKACRIGLLPQDLSGKISVVGNIAGVGAKMLVLDKQQLAKSQRLLGEIDFLELAMRPSFQRAFSQSMLFVEE